MRRSLCAALLCLCAACALAACKASKSGNGVDVYETPAEQVAVLVDQGLLDQASDVVANKEAFFASAYGDPEVKAILDRLAGALEFKYAPAISELKNGADDLNRPVSRSQWATIKTEMAELQSQYDTLRGVSVFKYPQYRPAGYDEAIDAFEAAQDRLRAGAAKAFAGYPLEGGDFFAEYPVQLDAPSFLDENKSVWQKAIAGFSAGQTEAFLTAYGKSLPASTKDDMAEKYFRSLCPKGKDASLQEILLAYEKSRKAGFDLKTIPEIKVAFLQVTSPDLIKDKAIDFPINVKVDVPFDASKASMRQAFSHPAVKGADILVLMNVAVSKAKRVVDRNEKIKSTYVASFTREDNPEYEILMAELEAASDEYHEAKNRKTTSWAQDFIVHLIEESEKEDQIEDADKRLAELKKKVRSTPKYISTPDYQPYPVSMAHMDIYKFATVNYYIVDKRNNVFFKDTFDVSQKSFFTVCYDMHESDPNREKFMQTSVFEDDVVRYEMEPVTVNLSDLLDQYVTRQSSWKKYSNMGSVHRVVVKDTSAAQLKHKNESYEYDKYHDKRFDSVVVVRNLGSGIGTGFYVAEDMVLTNYHVVEENNYVKLKLFSGQDTMGRVIARDAQLDLALVQADVKQRPVCFYDKRTIPLGETVELIGHPNGLEFSITRGALSAIRELPPINFNGSTSWIKYIQTDAAINGGNSGGPMFIGNYVVGVNDWKFLKTGGGNTAEGLNFAIHYSEVFNFLNDNGISFCKGRK